MPDLRKSSMLFVLLVGFIILCGCGSSGVKSTPPPTQAATPDFTLSATPAQLTVTSGAPGQALTVAATGLNGFSGSINVALSGLPAGVTATPSTLVLTAGMSKTVTLAAAGTAVASSTTFTATGTAGKLTHFATAALSIAAPAQGPIPDYSLSLTPNTLAVQDGGAAQTVAIAANPSNGFTGSVAVQLTGLPSGLTAAPSSLTLTPGAPQNITFTATTAAPGPATINVAATSDAASGSIAHSTTLPVTISAAASFSLTLSPTAQTISIGNAAGAQVAVTANAANGFTGQVAVSLSGLPTGVTANPSTLTLTPGTAQSITFNAGYSAGTGTSTVTFDGTSTGTSGAQSSSANLALTVQAAPVADVVTYHYDNARDGLNAQETILTPANVNAATFGKTGFYAADGKVDAAPLFAAQVPTSQGVTNVVYVATEHDSLYAFNASTGAQIWKTSLLGSNESTAPAPSGCSQIAPEIGITATPVIDRTAGPNGTIFLVAMSKDSSGKYHQRLHALDLATGAEQSGSPSEIAASFPGTGDNSSAGSVIFDPAQYAERAALLLLNGTVYTTWTSHCDARPYTGWVMGYSEQTLQQTQVLNLTPNGSEGAVWMSGNGPAADNAGNLYLLDANGSFQDAINAAGFPSDGDYGNAILKLGTAGTLSVSDYFEPYNTVAESNADQDLGSGGTMLLPDQTDANGHVRHLVLGAGKDGNIYVADRDNMGKFNQATQDNSNLYQQVSSALANGAWSSPAYFNGTVYYAGQGDVLKAFPITQARLAATPSSKSTQVFNYPGSTPTVSANGAGNGIVWALEDATGAAAVLHAYDATDLSKELYNSNQQQPGGASSTFGKGNKFLTPVVINGNVYVGTPNGVAVFGLLPQ